MLFFRLADVLSTSRFDPSISISIKTGLKSFLKIARILYFIVPISYLFLTHPFLRPDEWDSSTMMVGGSEVFLAGISFPSWQWLHLYETTSPRHGLLMIKMTDTDNVGNGQMFPAMWLQWHCPVSSVPLVSVSSLRPIRVAPVSSIRSPWAEHNNSSSRITKPD